MQPVILKISINPNSQLDSRKVREIGARARLSTGHGNPLLDPLPRLLVRERIAPGVVQHRDRVVDLLAGVCHPAGGAVVRSRQFVALVVGALGFEDVRWEAVRVIGTGVGPRADDVVLLRMYVML